MVIWRGSLLTGTGKELIARAIHNLSTRRKKRFGEIELRRDSRRTARE
jgi:transcriptional regulator with GAF, ATPase, and Fis domain